MNRVRTEVSISEIPNFWDMERWISSEIFETNGGTYSWKRGKENGYLYDEITGYGIKLYMYLYDVYKDPRFLDMAKRSVDYINSKVTKFGGGIAREGIYYVFDTAMCLSGVLSYYCYVPDTVIPDSKFLYDRSRYEKSIKSLLNFSYYNLLHKSPIILNGTMQTEFDFNHWSLSYGSHLLKCCIALEQSSDFFKDKKEKYDLLINRLCRDITSNFHEGHFHTNINSKDVYTHSHCYATEGLIYLQRPEYLDIIKQSADWLADVQNLDGSLYNRYFSTKIQEKVADITAQAIRIWTWTDKEKFEPNIMKGFNFLKSLQSSEGGIYYKIGSNDINSWATMFTMNALLWYHNGANIKWLV